MKVSDIRKHWHGMEVDEHRTILPQEIDRIDVMPHVGPKNVIDAPSRVRITWMPGALAD